MVGGEDSRGKLGAASYFKLFVDVAHMGVDGVRRDVEPTGNLLFGIRQKELAADLDLAWREFEFFGNALPGFMTKLPAVHRAGERSGSWCSGRFLLPIRRRRLVGWNAHYQFLF